VVSKIRVATTNCQFNSVKVEGSTANPIVCTGTVERSRFTNVALLGTFPFTWTGTDCDFDGLTTPLPNSGPGLIDSGSGNYWINVYPRGSYPDLYSTLVSTAGDQTIGGTKTFTSTLLSTSNVLTLLPNGSALARDVNTPANPGDTVYVDFPVIVCRDPQDYSQTLSVSRTGAAVAGSLSLGALHDSAAPNGSLYLGLDHLDGAGAPKLCRKDSSGNVNVIG
jgi:hypothetical protein